MIMFYYLDIPTLLYGNTRTLRLRWPVTLWSAVHWLQAKGSDSAWNTIRMIYLGFSALLMIGSLTLLLVATLLFIDLLTALDWRLLAVVEVESATLLPGNDLTVVPGHCLVGGLGALVTLLTLLPLDVSVFLDVHLPALLVGDVLALLSGYFGALLVVDRLTFLLRNLTKGDAVSSLYVCLSVHIYLYTILDVLASLLRNILTALRVGGVAFLKFKIESN